MSDTTAPVVLPLPGVPAGLVAVVRPRPDGTVPRDRRGRVKTTRVTLTRDPDSVPLDPGAAIDWLSGAERRWVTAASSRQWASILRKFGDRATEVAYRLGAAGAVTLDCEVGPRAQLDRIRGWALTPHWEAERASRSEERARHHATWATRATTAADAVTDADSGLAGALRATPHWSPILPVLVHAAEDLFTGVIHDGPRAFSQTHFGDTKERDHAPKVLRDAGASIDTLLALGLLRSPYLGLGGPLTVTTGDGNLLLSGLPGPTLFRVNTDAALTVRLTRRDATVAVIENQQAAEAACDLYPDLAVLYCAGQPSDVALKVLQSVAATACRVLLIPDADLGGVRIAARLYEAVDEHDQVEIVDVGRVPHEPGRTLGEVSIAGLRQLTDSKSPVARFAQACLARGYRVEQEAVVRAALNAALAGPSDGNPSADR